MWHVLILTILALLSAPLAQAETWEEFQKLKATEEEPAVMLKGGPKIISKDVIIEGLRQDCQFTFQSDALLFHYGSSRLKEESIPTIENTALALKEALKDKELSQIKLYYVDGHTCSIGTEENNCRLSWMRTKTVVDELAQRGVPREMLVARGFGKIYPAHSNDTEPTRMLNRRVVLKGDCPQMAAKEEQVPCPKAPEDRPPTSTGAGTRPDTAPVPSTSQVSTPSRTETWYTPTEENPVTPPAPESVDEGSAVADKAPQGNRILPPGFRPVGSPKDQERIIKEPGAVLDRQAPSKKLAP